MSIKVFVYYNLHKKCFSVRALNGPNKGRVVAHLLEVSLRNCYFKVSQAGRNRVLKEKRKNVHAGVVGFMNEIEENNSFKVEVAYNPYKYSSFVIKSTEEPISTAESCFLSYRKVYIK
jgi:hypothetical protein